VQKTFVKSLLRRTVMLHHDPHARKQRINKAFISLVGRILKRKLRIPPTEEVVKKLIEGKWSEKSLAPNDLQAIFTPEE